MSDLERRLKRIVLLVALLGLAGMIFGMLPGEQTYDDANQCARPFAAIFTENSRPSSCTPSYTIPGDTHPAGGAPVNAFVLITLAYGAAVRLSASRWLAIGWTAWTALTVIGVVAATFKLDFSSSGRSVTLWPEPVMYTLIGAMLVLIGPVTWLVAFASRRTADDTPSARVVAR